MSRPIPIRTEADKERALADVNDIEPETDRPYVVTIKREARVRSLSQNNLFHKWAQIAADDLGWDLADMKEGLKEKCDCPWHVYTDLDGNAKRRRSTAHAEKAEMAAFMDRVFRLLSEYGIRLPIPEQAHLR